jgi:hypothetical protein
MTNNYTITNSTTVGNNAKCDYIDPLSDYIDKVISVVVPNRSTPIRGRLVRLDSDYLYIERLSGTKTVVHRHTILRISTARDVKQVI